MLSTAERRQLDEAGWLALPGLMSPQLLKAVRARVEELFEREGSAAGSEFKMEPGARRLANLVNKGRIFEQIILTPRVAECMAEVLGPRFKLSSLNVRSADPHSGCGQPLHADSGAVAD
ncbi:MAG TPA: phytanoyl-CoA dioxygenase family protein, partial [Candidatus Sulfopaludibacter sp.]|nr:phytanoyl-CoA dioxygenase family protein [Candidatus Sulfopaludibacter sp.]